MCLLRRKLLLSVRQQKKVKDILSQAVNIKHGIPGDQLLQYGGWSVMLISLHIQVLSKVDRINPKISQICDSLERMGNKEKQMIVY